MSGHRPFTELTRDFTPERRARVAAKAAAFRETIAVPTLELIEAETKLREPPKPETLARADTAGEAPPTDRPPEEGPAHVEIVDCH